MKVLISIHVLQVITLIVVTFFTDEDNLNIFLTSCCASFTPFIMYVYVAAATGTLKGCETGMKIWLITNCIIFGFLLIESFPYFYKVAVQHETSRL